MASLAPDDTRVALITGGASGIGRATAIVLAKRGFSVIIADVSVESGETAVEEIVKGGGKAKFSRLDVGSAEEWESAVQFAVKEFGGLHVLVNNAGISGSRQTIENTPFDEYERVIKITSTSVFLGCKIAAPELFKAGRKGSVINVASMMSHIGGTGNNPGYHAAKGAVRSITKNVAIAWASKGVRVNSVHPGYIDTPLIRRTTAADGGGRLERLRELTPLNRLGTSEEIATAIAFLAGDDSSFMTGSELIVDGGYLAQ